MTSTFGGASPWSSSSDADWPTELAKLPGVHVYPSVTNFLLVRLDRADVTAPELADRLLRAGHRHPHVHRGAASRRAILPRGRSHGGGEHAAVRRLGRRARESPRRRRQRSVATPAIMLQGTSSNAGKSVLTAALCRILLQDGVRVAPFKSQNMSLNSFVARDGGEMGRAQVVQAQACRLEPDVRMNPILLKPCSDTGCQVIVRGKPVGNMAVGEYVRYKPQAFAAAKECYDSLAAEFDAIVLEGRRLAGRGEPEEPRHRQHADGRVSRPRRCWWSATSTAAASSPRSSARWKCSPRGNASRSPAGSSIASAATRACWAPRWTTRSRTPAGPCWASCRICRISVCPQEDSVEFKSGALDQAAGDDAAVEIAVIDLPHISNFTDFDAFAAERDVRLRIVRSAGRSELRPTP